VRKLAGPIRTDFLADRTFDRCDEFVTTPGKSLDEGRTVGGIAKRFAQPFNGGIQAGLEIDKRVPVPECGTQFLPGYDFAGALEQFEEHLIGLILKPQFHAVLAQLYGSQIELEYSEAVHGSVLGRHGYTYSGRKLPLV
jgi:hypothetical protein